MTEHDISMLVAWVRERANRYGYMLVEVNLHHSHADRWPKVDGKPAIAFVDPVDQSNDIQVYEIDTSMTFGQFVDTFDVTMKVKYNRQLSTAPSTANAGMYQAAINGPLPPYHPPMVAGPGAVLHGAKLDATFGPAPKGVFGRLFGT